MVSDLNADDVLGFMEEGFRRSHTASQCEDGRVGKTICKQVLKGRNRRLLPHHSSRCGTRCPLMYQWYGEEYLGVNGARFALLVL